jgi:ribose transport system permease protein
MTERQKNLRLFLPVYIIFLLIYLLACILEPTFFTWGNNVNLFTRITPLVLVGIAQTYVVLTGGIDLSIGAMIGLANVIAVSLPFVDTPLNIALWLVVPPLVGLVVGFINGVIITRGGFPPLIVTLATGAIWQGVSLFILSQPGGNISSGVSTQLTGKLFNLIPIPLIIILSSILIFHILLRRTSFGRSVYAIGGNELIAIESGIRVHRVKVGVYSLSGFVAGIAGMYLSGWMNSGDPLVGEPYILNSIAVTVIGGTGLMGGSGGVIGILGGAYIYHLINNILNLMAVSTFYQYVVKGLVLIVALAATSTAGGMTFRTYRRKMLQTVEGQS